MGKILNVVCIMMMIILVFVIGGEVDCNVICSIYCSKFLVLVERCFVCYKICNVFLLFVRIEILKI